MSNIVYDNRTCVTLNVSIYFPGEETTTYNIYFKNLELTNLSEKDILFIRDSINKLLK